jgi:hypothetical protein
MRMRDGDSLVENLNAFNTLVGELVSVEILIDLPKFQMKISVSVYCALYQTHGIV